MRSGDFAAAWSVCDEVLQRRLRAREDCSSWPRHQQFVWNGEPLDGKRVLVRCYHGLGDTIQFVRLLAELRPRVAEITLWAQPALLDLLRSVRGVDRLLPLHDGVPDVDYDVDIELMELPHALRLTLDTLPSRVPYLHVPGARNRPLWPPRNVGLVWRSGDWLPQRSIPDAEVARLAQASGIRWHSLQYPHRKPPLTAVDLACRDICTMAARMLTLDLIISVDTMAAHLAGALALPVWTLLHEPSDWRWLAAGEDSRWYPTMRLFRQGAGAWRDVIDRVLLTLQSDARPRTLR